VSYSYGCEGCGSGARNLCVKEARAAAAPAVKRPRPAPKQRPSPPPSNRARGARTAESDPTCDDGVSATAK
jgi:hypothetical protein